MTKINFSLATITNNQLYTCFLKPAGKLLIELIKMLFQLFIWGVTVGIGLAKCCCSCWTITNKTQKSSNILPKQNSVEDNIWGYLGNELFPMGKKRFENGIFHVYLNKFDEDSKKEFKSVNVNETSYISAFYRFPKEPFKFAIYIENTNKSDEKDIHVYMIEIHNDGSMTKQIASYENVDSSDPAKLDLRVFLEGDNDKELDKIEKKN